jgi:hypothetical protein
MAFENITSLAESFDRSLTKIAAKEKTSKKSLSKKLEKARAEHQKLSEELKRVQKEYDKIKSVFDDLKGRVSAKRKEIISLQNAGQKMDLANASDAIFHQDTNDVSYVIDGKEYHVEVDGEGEIQTVPWRDHRKAQKPAQPESIEGNEENAEQSLDAEDCGDSEVVTDAANMDQAMLDDLYLKMTEEKTASYSDLIKKWGAEQKDWIESSLLSGDWYKSLGDKVQTYHENGVPSELSDPDYDDQWPEIDSFTDEEIDAGIAQWEAENDQREEENAYHHPTECPGGHCIHHPSVRRKPTGKEITESNYNPGIDSEIEKENILESEGKPTPWPEFDESLADDTNNKKSKKRKPKYSLEPREYDYDHDPYFNEDAMRELMGYETKLSDNLSAKDKPLNTPMDEDLFDEFEEPRNAALEVLLKCEERQKQAEKRYHQIYGKADKNTEHYGNYMKGFWQDTEDAHKAYHAYGGRLGA